MLTSLGFVIFHHLISTTYPVLSPTINATLQLKKSLTIAKHSWTTLVLQWVRIHLSMQGNGFNLWSRKIPHATEQLKLLFNSVARSCSTLCDPMDYGTPGFPVLHQLLELAQTQVHWVSDAIQPPHSLLSPSPPAFNLSQHQSFPASQFFTSGDQSTGISVSALILPVKFRTDFL